MPDTNKHINLVFAALQGNSDIVIANEAARRVQARAEREGVDKIPFRWFREERDKMFGITQSKNTYKSLNLNSVGEMKRHD